MKKKYYVWRICDGSSMCVYDGPFKLCNEYVAKRGDTGRAEYIIEGGT